MSEVPAVIRPPWCSAVHTFDEVKDADGIMYESELLPAGQAWPTAAFVLVGFERPSGRTPPAVEL